MTENAAQNGKAGIAKTMPVSRPLIVERQRIEIALENKWPRAWRMLFLVGAAAALWAVVIVSARLL